MNIKQSIYFRALIITMFIASQSLLWTKAVIAQFESDYKLTKPEIESLCVTAAAGRDNVDYTMSVFQNNIKAFFLVTGLDENSNDSYNLWWEKYYKDIVCDIKEERDMFGGLIQKAEKRTLLQHIVLEDPYESNLKRYDEYFKGAMWLNINVIGFDGETVTSWLDKKIAESEGRDKEYFEKIQTHFIENYGAKRTEEVVSDK